MLVKQFNTGSIITVNNAPHIVESVEKHTPSARGAATIYKIRCRNLVDQTKTDLSCKGEDNYPEPDVRPSWTYLVLHQFLSCPWATSFF